jgi:hypothetical protein
VRRLGLVLERGVLWLVLLALVPVVIVVAVWLLFAGFGRMR